ncbi:MAG: hypothetical protein RBT74_00415 [Tenuifilaceae bacterium]|jgi:hypothetical protein|nr:hypothetical protein [Tenuifilaceae bacterium]
MKAKRKVLALALVLVSVAVFFGSCAKKSCPAYSKANTVQTDRNS